MAHRHHVASETVIAHGWSEGDQVGTGRNVRHVIVYTLRLATGRMPSCQDMSLAKVLQQNGVPSDRVQRTAIASRWKVTMAKNELRAGHSRIGFAWDADSRDPYPAMLRDRDGRIELVIPIDDADDVLRRRYIGDLVTWGDDPDRSRFSYGVPSQFWFADAHGFVCLVAVRRRVVDPLAGGPTTMSECRLDVGYAIFTASPDANFARVNGLSSEIEGLGRWYGRRSVSVPEDYFRGRGARDITLTIHAPREIRLAATMNLSLIAGAKWGMPGEPGLTSIEEVGQVQTMLIHHREWSDHLDLHRAVHELLEISAWQPLGFRRLRAMHHRDPHRVLTGRAIGDRWADVATYALPTDTQPRRVEFFFEFDHVGAPGVRRWLRLRHRFNRGIRAMSFSIRNRGTSLDGLISDAGIGLEEIGHQIAAERGSTTRRPHHVQLQDIAAEIATLLPFDGNTWASRSTAIYNDVKHADRPDPTPEDMLSSLRENRIVFRVWLAHRLGMKTSDIRKQVDRQMR